MHQFQAFRILHIEIDAGDAAVVDLPPELAEVGAALVIDPCLGEEAACIVGLEDANGEIDVLAEAHLGESLEPLIHLFLDAHVEGSGVELIHFFLPPTDSAGGEEACHGVGDGLLNVGERLVGAVGSAKGVAVGRRQFLVHGLKIPLRNHDIGVENDEPFALRALRAVVTTLSGAAVVLVIVVDIQLFSISFAYFPTGICRSVLHDEHLKIAGLLAGEALQKLFYFVRTIINGNDEAVFHIYIRSVRNFKR